MDNTFHLDFAIAEHFGMAAIEDTFQRAFKEWRTNYKMLAELVIVLNHRCWMWYDKGNEELSRKYADYYYEAHGWALDHLKDAAFDYYFERVD